MADPRRKSPILARGVSRKRDDIFIYICTHARNIVVLASKIYLFDVWYFAPSTSPVFGESPSDSLSYALQTFRSRKLQTFSFPRV